MTLAACGLINWPMKIHGSGVTASALTRSTVTFDSVNDKVAYIGTAQNSDTITKVYFRTGNVTTGCTVEVRIETVVNGRPSGTLLGTTTNTTVAIADADDNVWKTATLTSAASVSAGTEFAIIIIYSSGTTPNLTFTITDSYQSGLQGLYARCLNDATGTWLSLGAAFQWIVEMGTAGVVCLPALCPADGNGTIHAPTNASTPDEYAMKFVAPFKGRVVGAMVCMFNLAVGADFTISLWPASSSVDGDALAQKALDGDFPVTTTEDGYVSVFFTNVELAAGTTYYLGVRADTANAIGVGSYPVPAGITNAIRGFPIDGNTVHQAYRTWTAGTAGAWTDVTTTFPIISLIIDQLDDGAGGGGGRPEIRGSNL